MNKSRLPVDEILPRLRDILGASNAVTLSAPPGSGKTTRVAPGMLDLVPPDQQIILLQPRRVAAKAAAHRIADENSWKMGGLVGYQVRFDSRVSPDTRIVVATEGILLRRLRDDPLLDKVGVIIFDEFHERSLNADLLLGFVRRLQKALRADLKLVVMSATLAGQELSSYLSDAPTLEADGQLFPVDVRYRPPRLTTKWLEHTADTIRDVAGNATGDILVFLPGQGEIYRLQHLLDSLARGWDLLPLHGGLPLEQQTATLFSRQRPRIVLATNVAETSLTLEGIRTVIDSGLARVLRFDPQVGLDRLELEPISQASATQRAGRAGRLSEGQCIRLWDAAAQRSRAAFLEPEICRVDLAGAVLELAAWGESPLDFPWLTPPKPESIAAALSLLEMLGALRDGRITALGRQLVRMPVSPRLARLLVAAHSKRCLEKAAIAAAMLSERDPFVRASVPGIGKRLSPISTPAARWHCDVTERVEALVDFFQNGRDQTAFGEVHRGAAGNIRQTAKQLHEQTLEELGDSSSLSGSDDRELAKCLLLAFPDRLARRRAPNDSRGLMVGGRGVRLANSSGVTQSELFLCIDVEGSGSDANVRQASAVEREWLPKELLTEREELFFHPSQKQVVARNRVYWGDLILEEHSIPVSDRGTCRDLLFQEASRSSRDVFPEDEAVESFRNRVACLSAWLPERGLPVCDEVLLREVLRDLCVDRKSFAELKSAPWLDWIRSRYSMDQLALIDREAPEKIEVPSGSRIKLVYAPGKPPVLAVRIQEVFSWRATPRIAEGRVSILLHLLAPNFRPQQITDDLASFWANTYETVRKELKRRYPKHSWPDDPLTASPVKKG